MRRLVIVLVMLGLVGPAVADEPAPAPSGPVRLDPVKQIERQRLDEKEGRGGRSGFWTSRQPAKGGAYRWRMLGIGLVLVGITGGAIMLLIRRANRANAERQAKEREHGAKPAKPADNTPIAAKPADDNPDATAADKPDAA